MPHTVHVARPTTDPHADRKKCRRCLDRHPRTHFPYGKRLCRRCHTILYKRRRWRADPHHHRAIVRRSRAKARRERGAEFALRNRNHNLKVRYGITIDQYEAMLRRQGGCCASCKRPPTGERPLSVDHKYGTTPVLIRGAICSRCNTCIGFVEDCVKTLKAMIRYVEREERELGKRKARRFAAQSRNRRSQVHTGQ